MLNYLEANIDISIPLHQTLSNCHELLFINNKSSSTNYEGIGMAWKIDVNGSKQFLSHDGQFFNSALIIFDKNRKKGMVVLGNTETESTINIGHKLFDWFIDE
jgi:hypothetical protein